MILLLLACEGPPDALVETGQDVDCDAPGTVCTWLGVPQVALMSGEGLHRLKTNLYLPVDITFGPSGEAYYPDYNIHRIRRVDPDGFVTTVSGNGMLGDGPNTNGAAKNCWEGCDALLSAWNHPTDVAIDPSETGVLWVAAWHNSRVNRLDQREGTMSWWAGNGGRNYGDGTADPNGDGLFRDDAVLDLPSSVAVAPDGALYFSDQANHLVRCVHPDGTVEVVAGQPRRAGFGGDGGPAVDAHLHGHTDSKVDPGSKLVLDGRRLLVADTINGVIRAIDLDTGLIETVAGRYESLGTGMLVDGATGVAYEADLGSIPGYSGDGGDALDAVFDLPTDVAVGPDGALYVADRRNHCVRVVRDGIVDRFAGRCGESGYDGDGGPALDALFSEVYGVAVGPDGAVYVADTQNHVIRRVAP